MRIWLCSLVDMADLSDPHRSRCSKTDATLAQNPSDPNVLHATQHLRRGRA
jgi:hypothetical protein